MARQGFLMTSTLKGDVGSKTTYLHMIKNIFTLNHGPKNFEKTIA